jgi:simple sugar transport system permease protein
MNLRYRLISLSAPILALSLSVLLTSLILTAIGKDPIETFVLMYDYGTTGKSLVSVFNRFIPLYISAIAVAVGFKMGLFNIGVEGQYLLSALLAAAIGASFSVSRPLHILLIMLIATAISSVWGAIAGYLKVSRGIHEVISTIMLNYIGTGIIAYLLAQVFFERDENDSLKVPQTNYLPESGQIPPLNNLLGIEDLPNLHGFVIGAILIGIFYYWLIWKTSLGYDLRATGSNPIAAKFSGADPAKLIILAMLISGAIAGMVGMSGLMGYYHRYTIDFTSGLGFVGIGVALLGRNHPIGMALGAILISFLERSSQILDLKDVPKEIERIMQGIIILFVVIGYEIVRRYILTSQIKEASKEVLNE